MTTDDLDLFTGSGHDAFDESANRDLAELFLGDPRHHILAALNAGRVVGFLTAVDYVHPDKPRELFLNEVGVVATHPRRGIGRRLMAQGLKLAGAFGCQARGSRQTATIGPRWPSIGR